MKTNTTIIIASDHGGLELKNHIKEYLKLNFPEYETKDIGTNTNESVDYPDYARTAAKIVQKLENHLGILVCGTGIGVCIMANRFPEIRAALVYNEFTAKMAKEHNNANILCLGGRTTPPQTAEKLVNIWLTSTFEGGRHQHRLDKLEEI